MYSEYWFLVQTIKGAKISFGNLSIISTTFQRCYLGDAKTKTFFSKLANNDDADLTRYTFFYLAYLIENNQNPEVLKSANL